MFYIKNLMLTGRPEYLYVKLCVGSVRLHLELLNIGQAKRNGKRIANSMSVDKGDLRATELWVWHNSTVALMELMGWKCLPKWSGQQGNHRGRVCINQEACGIRKKTPKIYTTNVTIHECNCHNLAKGWTKEGRTHTSCYSLLCCLYSK